MMNANLKKVINKLDAESRSALDVAINVATVKGHVYITPEHMLLAISLEGENLLNSLALHTGLSINTLGAALNNVLDKISTNDAQIPVFSETLVEWLVGSWLLASTQWDQQHVCLKALLACLFNNQQNQWVSPVVRQALHCDRSQILEALHPSMDTISNTHSTTSGGALEKYTQNLSEQARKGKLDPVLGRESEIRQMVDILLRRRQNNPILIGEPGVGKTALVEGLALRIAEGSAPHTLASMEVRALDLCALQAGASVKGEFESRLQLLLKEIADTSNPIILFIDEAHTLIGAGGQAGQNDAANLLKPALARGELRIVAATTSKEYKKYFEKDAALTRRFQIVKVDEPDIFRATTMLRAMVPTMVHHHDVVVQESAIHAAVNLSSRYISGRQLPDKSVSLLDTACARVAISQAHEPKEVEEAKARFRALRREIDALKVENTAEDKQRKLTRQAEMLQLMIDKLQEEWQLQKRLVSQIQQCQDNDEIIQLREALAGRHQHHPMVFECVDATCVADVVSDWTGIPLGRMLEKEQHQLDALFERLAGRVIGQQHALEHIARQIRISRAGMGDPLKPGGVFLLAGPSGTGKTETSLALAELLFGGEQNLITINMSEYQEAHSVSGLKGSPPGYVGYGQGGVLTEAVRRNPYCVLLLDEVEKAHPDVMELFYQVFDKGVIEDAEGLQINFRNTLIIMTSNLGSAALINAIGEGESKPEELSTIIRPEFERVFSPALMGRMTLIPYLPLQLEALKEIIELKLLKLCLRYQNVSQSQERPVWSKSVINWVLDRCLISQSGARDIDHVLGEHLLPLLAAQVLQGRTAELLKIDVSKGCLKVRVGRSKE